MANAVIARDQGGDYQARFFWLQACRLFQPYTKVERVAYELNRIKSFDDVVVTYKGPLALERGDVTNADYYQVKFHVNRAGAFTYQSLVDPKFINATKLSLLQKLHAAQKAFAPRGQGCRLIIVSPWTVHPDDQLAELVSTNGGEIRMRVLFDGTGPGSRMGLVRSLWRQHLNLASDVDLEEVLRPLRIEKDAADLAGIDKLLNLHLSLAGFAPVEAGQLVHPYDDLIRKLLAKGFNEFTRDQLKDIGVREKLWHGLPSLHEDAGQIGIRSFTRWAEHMEDETEEMLDLVRHFDNRLVRDSKLWDDDILPQVSTFLSKYDRATRPYNLLLDTHSSIAFAAGYSLEVKAGADIAPVQRTPWGREVWRVNPKADVTSYPGWSEEEQAHASGGTDVAVAICATHDVTDDVREFVETQLTQVGRTIIFRLDPVPSSSAVRDGTHAFALAQRLAAVIKRRSRNERSGVLHIFGAAPNAIMFFLGQMGRGFGRCALYEYDFESNELGAYRPSITLPWALPTTAHT